MSGRTGGVIGLVFRWGLGATIGTLIVAATSPLFIRNYPPSVFSLQRQAVVKEPGQSVRWREEGYATSMVGTLGEVGVNSMESNGLSSEMYVALWGDSQAEGVCVSDRDKIAAQVEREFRTLAGERAAKVTCFARSGDHCNDWIAQIESLESNDSYPCAVHAFLVTEWSDWCRVVASPVEEIRPTEDFATRYVPAFLIQAARHALTIDASGTPRTLRWSVGPKAETVSGPDSIGPDAVAPERMQDRASEREQAVRELSVQVTRLGGATRRGGRNPGVVFLYAPLAPSITGGELIDKEDDEWFVEALSGAAQTIAARVVDLRPAMRRAVENGRWPRGFHHGRFGSGHYNSIGNRIIAEHLADQLIDHQSSRPSP